MTGMLDRLDDLGQQVAHEPVGAEMAAGLEALDDDRGRAELLGELGDARAADDRHHRDAGLLAPREDVAREARAGDDEVDALGDRGLDQLRELARRRP